MSAWNGDRAFVRYKVREALYHCRALLWKVEGAFYMVLSPDLDLYCEELADTNPDVKEVLFVTAGAALPAALGGKQIYDFSPQLPPPSRTSRLP